MKTQKYTIKDFKKDYPDDDACLNEIFQQRYGSEGKCQQCNKQTRFYRVRGRKCFACQFCGYQLHPLTGTIFHKSPTPLWLWFYSMFLFSASKNGVSAKELQRQLGVTYKTAWRIAKKIRELMKEGGNMLTGIVEADEMYVGGRARGKRGHGADKKTPVVGVVERKGEARVQVIKNISAQQIMRYIEQHVEQGTNLMTDEWGAYNDARYQYNHQTVQHGIKEYVRGDVHTNSIEGLWSQIKRSIHGTYHAISPKYLQEYLDEFSWRYNHRSSSTPAFLSLVVLAWTLVSQDQ